MEKVIRQVKMEPRRIKLQRVAAYARVSSGKEAMLHSLSEQISYYSDHIQSYERGADGTPVINETQAGIVRQIYGMFLDGQTPSSIAATLM